MNDARRPISLLNEISAELSGKWPALNDFYISVNTDCLCYPKITRTLSLCRQTSAVCQIAKH